MALIVQTTQVARAIDRALSGEMVKTLRPAACGVKIKLQASDAIDAI